MTMIHRLIVSGICILSLAAFSFVGVAQGASYFQVVTQNGNTETAGKGFFVTLVARNADGGTDTSYAEGHDITWATNAKSYPDGWTLRIPDSGVQSFEGGVAVCPNFTLPCAGTCTLFASDGIISGTSITITVNSGTATQFKLAAPPTAMAGTAFSLSDLRACDLYGNVATDYHGDKVLNYSGPGNGSITGSPKYPNPVTFDHGKANLPLKVTLYRAENTQIHIEAPGIGVKGDSSIITVNPGTPHYFEVTTENNQIEKAGTPFFITIRARDAYGNLATGYDVDYPIACTWTGTSSPSGTKPLDGTPTFTSGIATIQGFTLTNAFETPTISVTDGTFYGISGGITVSPGTATKFKVTTIHDNIETANTTFSVILTCQDTYENALTNFNGSYSIDWQWTANDMPGHSPSKPANGTQSFTNGRATIDGFTLTKANESPIIIAKSTISGTSTSIIVKPGEATTLTIKAPAEVNAGQAFLLSPIVAYDYCGNIATAYQGPKTLNYTGAANGPVSGTPNFTTHVNFSNGSSISTLTTTLIRAGTCSI